jgi:hypothetical protein
VSILARPNSVVRPQQQGKRFDANGVGEAHHHPQLNVVCAALDPGNVGLPNTGPPSHLGLRQSGLDPRVAKVSAELCLQFGGFVVDFFGHNLPTGTTSFKHRLTKK